MGFHYESPRINVTFEPGHEYHGAEVVLRRLNLAEYLDITGIGEVTGVTIGDQLKTMGDKLVSWNLEDAAGNPLPPTSEAVLRQDKDFMVSVCTAWIQALHGVSAPLEQNSPDGAQSLEESIPMDVPSESLAS